MGQDCSNFLHIVWKNATIGAKESGANVAEVWYIEVSYFLLRGKRRDLHRELFMKTFFKSTVMAAVAAVAMTGGASAATIVYSEEGNLPFNVDLVNSSLGINTPGLAKCDTGTDGATSKTCSDWEDGTALGDYSSAFNLSYTKESTGFYSFTWAFDPDAVTGTIEALFPHYVLVKQATNQDIWKLDEVEMLGGTINTELGDISHVSFYNTGEPTVIPLPAAGWLLLGSLGGIAALKRRRKPQA